MSFLARIGAAWKALSRDELRFPNAASLVTIPHLDAPTMDDLENEIGDGTGSDLLMSTLRWIQRAAIEAPLQALDAEGDPAPESSLQQIISHPNPFYGLDTLISATVFDLDTAGDAYWLPVEDGNGQVAELWWAPQTSMEPKWPSNPTAEQRRSGEAYISHYEYQVAGRIEELDPDSVIHFRQGVDPQNIRKGLSPLRGLLRELWTDNEAADFTAGLLRRGGVPGLVISPKSAEDELEDGTIEAAQARVDTKYTRGGRGKTLGFTCPVEVKQFGFDPKAMDLGTVRNIPEERVTAALGVAAAVVGFGTGLQAVSVGATMKELRRDSYQNGVVPLWRIIERTVTDRLAPMMRNGAASARFSRSDVAALQEDSGERSRRVVSEVRAGVITRAEAKAKLGYEVFPADDVYLLPISTVEVPAGETRQIEERSVRLLPAVKHEPTALEARLIETAPRAEPTPAMQAFTRSLDRIRRASVAPFTERLSDLFVRMGRAAASATGRVLGDRGERSAPVGEVKQEPAPDLISDILEAMGIDEYQAELSEILAAGYGQVATEVALALAETRAVVEFVEVDEYAVAVMREGGTRAGLIDLSKQTREALFEALAEGREEGLAGDNLARRIRDHVEAGPFWHDVDTRARVIARTEGAHAANTSTLQAARTIDDTSHVMVHDNRTGHDDELCIASDGLVVTIEEAEAMGLCHPNGTRSFTPINALLMEEMGL